MMDNDRELLERAAKAAGIQVRPMVMRPIVETEGDGFIGFMTEPWEWSRGWFDPLTDDGDALRLAVKLGINVFRGMAEPPYREPYPGRVFESERSVKADPYAATRRAIVRAAAAIGTRGE
jgi:hypothetical protein